MFENDGCCLLHGKHRVWTDMSARDALVIATHGPCGVGGGNECGTVCKETAEREVQAAGTCRLHAGVHGHKSFIDHPHFFVPL